MTEPICKIAAISSAKRSVTESLFAAVTADIRASGGRVVGVLAETPDFPDGVCGVGVLRDIVSGTPFSIRLDAAPKHTSCQLDSSGVAAACSRVLDQIAASDLVVLSKFGKLESMGLGLAPAFQAAISAHKPILTSISSLHRDAWRAFAPGAVELAPEANALLRWWGELHGSHEQIAVP